MRPLLEKMNLDPSCPACPGNRFMKLPEGTLAACLNHYAEALGMDHAYFRRKRREGFSPLMADKFAVTKAHLHPGEVWGDDWWEMDKRADLEVVA